MLVGEVELTEGQKERVVSLFDDVAQDGGQISVDDIARLIQDLTGEVPQLSLLEATIKALRISEPSVNLPQFEQIIARYLSQTTAWGKMAQQLAGAVGIDSLPQQLSKISIKGGFELNLMVVGRSGLGKSTMVNTVFKSMLSRTAAGTEGRSTIPKTAEIHSISHVIEENGVKLKLNVVDTPGFGDHVDNRNCWEPICDYIRQQYDQYFVEETAVNRKKRLPDGRIHCLLYFITPTGHALKPLDIQALKELSQITNVIPVIAKADTLTPEEREAFKDRIIEDISQNNIDVYPYTEDDDAHDEELEVEDDKLRDTMPFAVVGCEKPVVVNGKSVLGRKLRWGFVEVENVAHNDFVLLRDMLLKTHTLRLIDATHTGHYARHRAARLSNTVSV